MMEMLKMQQVGRHFYDPNAAVFVPQHKLELWPGFISAINNFDHGHLLTLDVSHKVSSSAPLIVGTPVTRPYSKTSNSLAMASTQASLIT